MVMGSVTSAVKAKKLTAKAGANSYVFNPQLSTVSAYRRGHRAKHRPPSPPKTSPLVDVETRGVGTTRLRPKRRRVKRERVWSRRALWGISLFRNADHAKKSALL